MENQKSSSEIKGHIKTYIKTKSQSVESDILSPMKKLEDEVKSTVNEIRSDRANLKSTIERKTSEIFQKRFTVEKSNEIIKKDCTDNCGKGKCK